MKIASYNVNGIRAALKKGFIDWLTATDPDVICLQEIKAQEDQLDLDLFLPRLDLITTTGLVHKKKAIVVLLVLCKTEPNHVEFGTGIESMDFEGRNLTS